MMTRAELDKRAEELGIHTSSRWKDETVAEKIAEAEAALAEQAGEDSVPGGGEAPAKAPEAAGNAASTPPKPDPEPAIITVTGPKRGRWRAGRHFTPQPVPIPLADLSDDEIAALAGDPYLTVSGLPQD